jgi:hypothetical protein
MKDLGIYKIQPIPDASFDTPTSLSISLAQKEHINATLNAQVVFTRDGELQQIPVYGFDGVEFFQPQDYQRDITTA